MPRPDAYDQAKGGVIGIGSRPDILARATTLPDTPRIGRRVPELDDPDIREVPAHSWRVIYQLRANAVFIVTLVHRRRSPTPDELRG